MMWRLIIFQRFNKIEKNKKILKVNNIHSLLNQENSELEYEAILNNPVLASFMSCKENMNQVNESLFHFLSE